MTAKIKGKTVKMQEELAVKRFYLPGIVITDDCPDCGQELEFDGSQDYISYPVVGEPYLLTLYCGECDTEVEVPIKLKIKVKLCD